MRKLNLQTDAFGITTIDTGFRRPGLVASYLIEEQGRYAFVDSGATSTLPVLLHAMQDLQVRPEQVDYVLVTHVHLDHAGAAGLLLQSLPEARLVVHPRGAPHMINPDKLIAGATAVYGEQAFRRIFGEIVPVPESRVIEAGDGFSLSLQGRELLFLDTPGHARHHYCVYDERSRGFFTGDTFGLSYRDFDQGEDVFLFPTTTPVQFDPQALHASIDRLISFQPRRMYLTHFGCITHLEKAAQRLHRQIDAFVGMAREVKASGDPCREAVSLRMRDFLFDQLREYGCRLSHENILALMQMDLDLNSQGICSWLDYLQHKGLDIPEAGTG